ncbi:nucleotide exchange factor Sil1 isoform X2 [Cataglyphis hispanica]|uniref:nucleotide exchange factor Sil1 isoform X2 n=1 Tax=Cataglyphis hispanica TaxID=1086592 RepID=UPI00218040AB|nr:nucleotide exchange factor Sil1 isoform X2 [Cataglyphis hispanica]
MRADTYILLIYLSLAIFGGAEKNDSAFVATHEWQTVKKGTPIPKGLHVRHNFATGVTEAKLMDDTEEVKEDDENTNRSNSKSLTLHPDKSVLENKEVDPVKIKKDSESLKFPIDELKARLKKLKQEEENISNNGEIRPKSEKHFKRFYETLKEELNALKLNVTSDTELLKRFLQKFQSYKSSVTTGTLTSIEIEEVLDLLNNLEYLLHQIDNAKIFSDMDGLTKIISPCLNGTNNEIKLEALRLLGAAAQSNPKVQAKALENDFIQKVLHVLSTNNKIEVKSRCLYALSALIRQFPAAQKAWIDHGGLQLFGKILYDDQLQIQMKSIKLINDLIIERQNLQEIYDIEQRQQKTREYAITDFEQRLLRHDYCKLLSNLMIKCFNEKLTSQFSIENNDFLEVVSDSMITISPVCRTEFKNIKLSLLPVIDNLLYFYQNLDNLKLTVDETDVLQSLILLIERLKVTIFEASHDEL